MIVLLNFPILIMKKIECVVVYYYRKVRLVKMYFRNKKALKWTLLWLVMIFCLLPTGCRDKSVKYCNRGKKQIEKAQYDLAIAEFNSALKINPKLFAT